VPCCPVDFNGQFGPIYHNHLYGLKCAPQMYIAVISAFCLLELLFGPEDGSGISLWGILKHYSWYYVYRILCCVTGKSTLKRKTLNYSSFYSFFSFHITPVMQSIDNLSWRSCRDLCDRSGQIFVLCLSRKIRDFLYEYITKWLIIWM
jgi:hypothetical protein